MTKQKETIEMTSVDGGWAEAEFAGIDLGDKRLNSRLIRVAEDFASQPEVPINHASKDWAATKAAYRLFGNANVTDKKLFGVHQKRTQERLLGEKVVLAIQDTTYLNYDDHDSCKGLGFIGTEELKGVIAHHTLMVTPNGLPLGLLTQELTTRTKLKRLNQGERRKLPIKKKESFRWIRALRKTTELARATERTVVTVCDRECDIFEFMHEAQVLGAPYVVRSCDNRNVADDDFDKLQILLRNQPAVGTFELTIPSRNGKKGRTAELEIRFAEITLPVSKNLRKYSYSDITVWAVMTNEKNPADPNDAMEWILLTNLPVSSCDDAVERLRWYQMRWQIEIFHKILKSGCNVEDCRLETIKRLKTYLSLFSVIAWRIFYCTHICRTAPNAPASTILSTVEIEALSMLAGKKDKTRKTINTVKVAVVEIAKLGGFLARRHDGFPGPTSIWRGFRKLANATEMWEITQALKCG